MRDMSKNASAFNQPTGEWSTAAVSNMCDVSQNASAFNQPLEAWNTSRLDDASVSTETCTSRPQHALHSMGPANELAPIGPNRSQYQ